jgi:cytochrome d ubiquinol oxidase subunit I
VARDNGVWVTFVALVIIYAGMVGGAIAVLRSMSRRWREGAPLDLPTPYSPAPYSPTDARSSR